MAVKIRLQRHGRKKNPYYKIVVADARSSRDGKFIEKIGFYNPMTIPATIDIDRQKALDWINKGAQPTDTVRAILRYKGVMYRKHLLRGVAKGAMTIEEADAKWDAFIKDKESRVEKYRNDAAGKKEATRIAISGTAKPATPKVEVPQEAAMDVVDEQTPEATESVADVPAAVDAVTEVVAEEAAKEESPAEEPSAEEPSAEEPASEGEEPAV